MNEHSRSIGAECLACGPIDSKVEETRKIVHETGDTTFRRRRKCRTCGGAFKTSEIKDAVANDVPGDS